MIIVNVDAGVDEVEEEKLNAARKETNDQLDVVVDGGQEDDGMTASQVGYDLLRGILDGHDVEQSGKPDLDATDGSGVDHEGGDGHRVHLVLRVVLPQFDVEGFHHALDAELAGCVRDHVWHAHMAADGSDGHDAAVVHLQHWRKKCPQHVQVT